MHQVTIPKRRGGARTIYVPSESEKSELRSQLRTITKDTEQPPDAWAFTKGRNAASMARQHIGYAFTLSFDLADCFDHVTADVLDREHVTYDPACLVDGAARQGLPTSPALANLALARLDRQVHAAIQGYSDPAPEYAYTRYADDLVLSFNDPALIPHLRERVPAICDAFGFPVHASKTRVQAARAGRRIICGIGVDDKGIHPTRETRRRHRAAAHQGHVRIARGLGEWMALRDPRTPAEVRDALEGEDVEPQIWRHALSAGGSASRARAAAHPELPPTMARRLARSSDQSVLAALAANEHVATEIRMAAQLRTARP